MKLGIVVYTVVPNGIPPSNDMPEARRAAARQRASNVRRRGTAVRERDAAVWDGSRLRQRSRSSARMKTLSPSL